MFDIRVIGYPTYSPTFNDPEASCVKKSLISFALALPCVSWLRGPASTRAPKPTSRQPMLRIKQSRHTPPETVYNDLKEVRSFARPAALAAGSLIPLAWGPREGREPRAGIGIS